MTPELMVYAIVAVGLVLWLRSVLGTRNGAERQRPNPFVIAADAARGGMPAKTPATAADAQAGIAELARNPTKTLSVENKAAENGLLQISEADRNFEIKFFLEGAQDAFVMIIEAFAKGEREVLRDLLAEPVYKSFDAAITAREQRGETASTEIVAVRQVEVMEASLQNRMAYITLRFSAEEVSVTRGADGVIREGHPERVVPVKDLWTFGRDTRSRDTRWLVYQTRGSEGEAIPDSQ